MTARRKTAILLWFVVIATVMAYASELRFCLRSEPKTFNPIMVDDDAAETIRYLTGGVLLRVNRQTQELQPELATYWKVSKDGRTITFSLREGLYFSDGSPFTADYVANTMTQLMDLAADLHGRCFPLRARQSCYLNPRQESHRHHVSSSGRRSRPAVRSGRNHFGALAKEGNGRPGAVLRSRLQTRQLHHAEA